MARNVDFRESNGRKRPRFRVAVHQSGSGEATHFFTVVYFGADEEQAAGSTKGRVVRVAGRLTAWKDQAGMERLGLVASEVAASAEAERVGWVPVAAGRRPAHAGSRRGHRLPATGPSGSTSSGRHTPPFKVRTRPTRTRWSLPDAPHTAPDRKEDDQSNDRYPWSPGARRP